MDLLSKYLEKFTHLKPTQKSIREAFIIIASQKGILISGDEIFYSNNTIFLKTKSIIKNEIFMQKNEFITKLNKELKSNIIKDIR